MNAPVRTFEIKAAVRERVPLLIGLMGPPGAGKTYSGLLLAEGMKKVGGGDPVVIDTEGGRSKKYADRVQIPPRRLRRAVSADRLPRGRAAGRGRGPVRHHHRLDER